MHGIKKVVLFGTVVFLAMGAVSCAPTEKIRTQDESVSTQKKVVVSVPPQKYFVEKIGGKRVSVTSMVEKGADPHSYEPKPSQMKAIEEADLYVTIGVQFEEVWIKKFQSMNSNMNVADQGEGVQRIVHAEHADPHIWLSPKRALIQAQNIYTTLVLIDPESEAYFAENLADFLEEIRLLDADVTHELEAAENNYFLVFHPAFSYFADDYGLTEMAIEVGGKEPSPRELSQVIARAKTENIKTIFIEPEFDKKSAETVAAEINGAVEEIDPLAENWNANLRAIARALSSK
ncbi:zinc ABC transporter substrate-binding protein [Patescibacteria group bacterium]|nr:zinc ABC transporter substrate-binding protein [Patescibacteria group bacterium]